MKRKGVREVLNELRWHPERDPARARIFYRDRQSEGGFAEIRGDDLDEVGPSSFTVGSSTIPYYKVFRVIYGTELMFEREEGPATDPA